MTFPDVPLANQWTDDEDLDAVLLNARIDDMLNALSARVAQAAFTAVTLKSGYQAVSPLTPGYITLGPWVICSGAITPVSGAWATSTEIDAVIAVGQLPAPGKAKNIGCAATGGAYAQATARINTDGSVDIRTGATVPSAASGFSIDKIIYLAGA